RHRRLRSLVHPVPALPDERSDLVARHLLALRSPHRSHPARLPLRLDPAPAASPPRNPATVPRRYPMSRRHALTVAFVGAFVVAIAAPRAFAFCGFYVAKGDAKLFNHASQVAIVRDEDRTVMTMANDFQGDPKEFAIVIPVPTKIEREQIHIADKALIDHLDAYSAPRLVEYFDPNPCEVVVYKEALSAAAPEPTSRADRERAKSLGVTIEAAYTVGEYDILILSAQQ